MSVHYWHLRQWAMQVTMELDIKSFKACNIFIDSFK